MKNNKVVFLDGAMGTLLQANGLKQGELPEVFGFLNDKIVEDIHEQYINSGSNIIYANTFGANSKKLMKSGYTVETIISKAIKQAKNAINNTNKLTTKIALDIGPIGEMIEPNGYLSFEAAYDIFKEMVVAGTQAGADIIVFETMSDLYEVKAAILAAKENSNLPIFVTMSFEADHRTFTGCKASSFALLAQGLGVSALGINCSLGPIEILPIAKEIAEYTTLPIIIKANAGLPDPLTNTYDISPNEFAKQMLEYKELNVKYIGGCCGTTPKFIEALVNNLDYDIVKTNIIEETYACTPTKCLNIKDVHVIGERINPTGNKRIKQALLDNNLNEILAIAIEQVDAGADILDVNVGLPGINEKEMMVALIKELQTIIDVPLQIDSTNPEVIEAALRAYNGIPIVNSVNGELAVMESILPSIAKYGSNIVGLTMNEAGIPKTAKERYNIAEYIITTASTYNIPKRRVFIDCLTLTVSAQQNAAQQTIEALTLVRKNLGVHTVLGVSNISFGLPNRTIINQSFLSIAMQAGLTMPIINPNRKEMMDAVRSFRVLNMIDIDCIDYINSYANMLTHKGVTPTNSTQAIKTLTIEEAIAKGLKDETRKLTEELLKVSTPLEIVDNNLIPALDIVGIKYENKEIYLPQLINAATASQCAFEAIKKHMLLNGGETISKGKIILATVKGDVHDIGKNIVKVVLENYGYQIIDLGKDVPVELVVSTAIKENVYLIGLSALMTTTLSSMEETVKALHESGHDCKIMVGGAVVSAEYAKSIKADYYARNAKESADIAKRVLK